MDDDRAPAGDSSPDRTPLPTAGAADERFAANLRRHLDSTGMSQGELARRMSSAGWPWHQQTVARILDGRRKPGVGEADAIALILGTTIARMLMPGPEAAAIGILEPTTGAAHRAWKQIAESARVLAASQRQLRRTVGEAEAAGFYGSALVRKLVEEAGQAIALDPYDAAEAGTGDEEPEGE